MDSKLMMKQIHSPLAPKAIGTYSQAIRAGNFVFLSGQIPLDPQTMTVVAGEFDARVHQVFKNLQAVVSAAGGQFKNIIKLTIFLTDLKQFSIVNEIMTKYFHEPFPARTTIEVSALPKDVDIEIDAIMMMPS